MFVYSHACMFILQSYAVEFKRTRRDIRLVPAACLYFLQQKLFQVRVSFTFFYNSTNKNNSTRVQKPLFKKDKLIQKKLINNGNRTEWSPIQSVSIRVINARVQFVNYEYNYRQNSTTRSPDIN